MIVYSYSKCSTCKNALHYLDERQISYVVKEITITPPTIKELEQMVALQKGNIKKLINSSGMLYRELQLSQKLPNMMVAEILHLLSQNGMLVKRPFVLSDTFGLLGFKKAEWDAKFG